MPPCWLITGAAGQLGGHVVSRLRSAVGERIVALCRGPVALPCEQRVADLAGPPEQLSAVVQAVRPTHVLHLAALTAVGEACANPARAEQVNVTATRVLAEAAEAVGAYFLHVSTDMVFDGEAAPYGEDAVPRPLSVYGRTKRLAEEALAGRRRVLIVRLPLLYGFPVTARATTFAQQIAALRSGAAGPPLRLFDDEYRTPLALSDAARALLGLARAETTGLLHVGGPERLSRYELVIRAAAALGLGLGLGQGLGLKQGPGQEPQLESETELERGTLRVERVSRLSQAFAEPRPADLSLDSTRFLRQHPELAPRPLSRATLEPGLAAGGDA